jgi:hypothetical protein
MGRHFDRHRGRRRAVLATLAMLAVVSGGVAGASSAAPAAPRWAPAASATIHPGVPLTIAQTTCMAGFVLTDGVRVFLSVPASCSGVSAGQAADGCRAAQMPLGIPVTIGGARYPGHLVYSSWASMQSTGFTGLDGCLHDNLSLVEVDRRDIARTNPSVPVSGGPKGAARTAPAQGDQLTVFLTTSSRALATGTASNGWSHSMVAAAPVVATDAGAPVLDSAGRALGMVSVVPPAAGGSCGVDDLAKEVAFLRTVHGFGRSRLADGTQAFS